MQGIFWPVRRVRRMGGSKVVTICPHARCYLELKVGDWISFWRTYWPGYLIIKKVPADLKGFMSRNGRRSYPLLITQVKGKAKAMYIVIPKGIDKLLGVEVGDLLLFGWTLTEGEFSIVGILGGRNSEGENHEAKNINPGAISTKGKNKKLFDISSTSTRQTEEAKHPGDHAGCRRGG